MVQPALVVSHVPHDKVPFSHDSVCDGVVPYGHFSLYMCDLIPPGAHGTHFLKEAPILKEHMTV